MGFGVFQKLIATRWTTINYDFILTLDSITPKSFFFNFKNIMCINRISASKLDKFWQVEICFVATVNKFSDFCTTNIITSFICHIPSGYEQSWHSTTSYTSSISINWKDWAFNNYWYCHGILFFVFLCLISFGFCKGVTDNW